MVLLGNADSVATQNTLRALRHAYLPRKVVALHNPAQAVAKDSPLAALLAGKTASGEEPVLFVCEHFTCRAPIAGEKAAIGAIEELAALREE